MKFILMLVLTVSFIGNIVSTLTYGINILIHFKGDLQACWCSGSRGHYCGIQLPDSPGYACDNQALYFCEASDTYATFIEHCGGVHNCNKGSTLGSAFCNEF